MTRARWRDLPEDVHQIRVATRRLITWLDLAGQRMLRDDLRRLRRAVEARRALQVLLERPLPPPVEAWARAQLVEGRGPLQEVLAAPAIPALITALALVPPLRLGSARRELSRRARQMLRRGKVLRQDSPRPAALHRLRVDVRAMRYGLEWISASPGPLLAMQEALGAHQDDHEAEQTLDHLGVDAPELRARLQADRAASLESARALWPDLKRWLRAPGRGEPLD